LSKQRDNGSLAQLVERFVYTEDVGSSSLSRPTIIPPVCMIPLDYKGYVTTVGLLWSTKVTLAGSIGRITLSQG
jgi:hypothetical protein